jgi:hypothetical protein
LGIFALQLFLGFFGNDIHRCLRNLDHVLEFRAAVNIYGFIPRGIQSSLLRLLAALLYYLSKLGSLFLVFFGLGPDHFNLGHQHNIHASTFTVDPPFEFGYIFKVLDGVIEQIKTKLKVSHFPTPEKACHLQAITFLEQFAGLGQFPLKIMFVNLGTQAQFFNLPEVLFARLGPTTMFLALGSVSEFTVIENTTYRGITVRTDFNQIQSRGLGLGQCFGQGKNA